MSLVVTAVSSCKDESQESRYMCDHKLTLADIRLFPTLIRFDAVYVLNFKTNRKRLLEYSNLLGYTRAL